MQNERSRRVRLLLGSLNDPYPQPRDSVGSLARHLSGPAPSRRVPCGFCLRSGYTAGKRLCPLCGGAGWRRRRKGEAPYDEYTGEPVATAETKPQHAPRFRLEDDYRRLGEQLERIEREQQAREGVYGDSYGWERARSAQERLGSYRELRRALERLQHVSPGGYAIVRAAWLRNVPVRLVGQTVAIEQGAVEWLAAEMRGEVRVPPWLLVDVERERRQTFAQLVAAGHSASEIARRLNTSRKQVKKMLASARPSVRAA